MKTRLLKQLINPQTLATMLVLLALAACKPKAQDPETTAAETAKATAEATAAASQPAESPAQPATADANAASQAAPASPTADGGKVRYEAQFTGNKMKMEGTSSIHDWTMESMILGGFIEADAGFPESALTNPEAAKPTVEVSMPVRSFKSNSKTMDGRMQEQMKESQYKKIEYKLIELKPTSPAGTTGKIQFDAVGALTVAGTTKTNTMPVTIEKLPGDKIKITGSTPLKMTDFNVEPPKIAVLGITTGDDIKINFEWSLAKKAK